MYSITLLVLQSHFMIRISDVQSGRFGHIYPCLFIILFLLFINLGLSWWWLILFNICLCAAPHLSRMWKSYYFPKQLDRDLFLFVGQVILNIRSGLSFRSSYKKALDSFPSRRTSHFLENLLLALSLGKELSVKGRRPKELLRILKYIQRHPHKSLYFMVFLKKRWEFQDKIEREMSSSLMQVRVQVFVMVVFYVASSIWYWSHSGGLIPFVAASFFFILGTFCHFYLQRRLVWSL